jgi:hypothetical protein
VAGASRRTCGAVLMTGGSQSGLGGACKGFLFLTCEEKRVVGRCEGGVRLVGHQPSMSVRAKGLGEADRSLRGGLVMRCK